MPNKTAVEIAEMLLERTGQAMHTGDVETFVACFALPYEHETPDNRMVFHQEDELRAVFKQLRNYYAKIGVTKVVRYCIAAEYKTETTICTTHESHVFHGNTRIRPPYPVMGILELIDGEWRIRSGNYAIFEDANHAAALVPNTSHELTGPGTSG